MPLFFCYGDKGNPRVCRTGRDGCFGPRLDCRLTFGSLVSILSAHSALCDRFSADFSGWVFWVNLPLIASGGLGVLAGKPEDN